MDRYPDVIKMPRDTVMSNVDEIELREKLKNIGKKYIMLRQKLADLAHEHNHLITRKNMGIVNALNHLKQENVTRVEIKKAVNVLELALQNQ